jgi:hypothetical protein
MSNNSPCEEPADRLNQTSSIEHESGFSLISIHVIIGNGFWLTCIE